MSSNMTRLGSPPVTESKKQTWVQTERASHEAWAALVRKNASAASLMHVLVAHMDHQSAIVASRATLAELSRCSEATIKRSVAILKSERWIEVVQVGGKGGVNAYIVNSRVAWSDKRDRLPGARFTATVLAREAEQESIEDTPLRRIPTLYPGERQLPSGDGETPPSQPAIAGMEVDLPSVAGRVDAETGEII